MCNIRAPLSLGISRIPTCVFVYCFAFRPSVIRAELNTWVTMSISIPGRLLYYFLSLAPGSGGICNFPPHSEPLGIISTLLWLSGISTQEECCSGVVVHNSYMPCMSSTHCSSYAPFKDASVVYAANGRACSSKGGRGRGHGRLLGLPQAGEK